MSVLETAGTFNCKEAIVLFPQVNEADDNGKFGIVIAFKKGSEGLKAIKATYDALVKEHYGDKKLPSKFKIPFHDGDTKMYVDKVTGEETVRAGYEGTVYLNMRTKNKPFVVDPTGKKQAPDGMLVHGRYCVVNCTPFIWDFTNPQGMRTVGFSFGLNAIQCTNNCDSLPGGGGPSIDPLTAFTDVSGEAGSAPEDDPANYGNEPQDEDTSGMFD